MSTSTPNEAEISQRYGVTMRRIGPLHYRATNAQGASIDFGRGEGLLTPVELLLAAAAGCAAVDVDVVTSRRSEPEHFVVHAEGDRINEGGASRLAELRLAFDISFPDTPAGRQAQELVSRVMKISQSTDCTVSRTVEHPTRVEFTELRP